MTAGKLIREVADKTDKRRTTIALSPQGRKVCDRLAVVCDDVAAAVEDISSATRHDLWRAIGEWEEQLAQKAFCNG